MKFFIFLKFLLKEILIVYKNWGSKKNIFMQFYASYKWNIYFYYNSFKDIYF